jgi:hypothetical protein
LAGLHGERFVFKLLGQSPALEDSQIAALRSRSAFGILLRQILKAGSSADLLEQIVGLGFCRCQSGSILSRLRGVLIFRSVTAGGGRIGGRLLRRDQDLAQPYRLGCSISFLWAS